MSDPISADRLCIVATEYVNPECMPPSGRRKQGGYCCWELLTAYIVYDATQGEQVLRVDEKLRSGICARFCCKPHHDFEMTVSNVHGTAKYVRIAHPGRNICCSCTEGCTEKAVVYDAVTGSTLGWFVQRPGGFRPVVNVMGKQSPPDGAQVPVVMAQAEGPGMFFGGCFSHVFKITRAGTDIATIDYVEQTASSDTFKDYRGHPLRTMTFHDQTLSSADRLLYTSLFLYLDMLFFEKDGATTGPGNCSCNFFNLYCLGCLWPCNCHCDGEGN